MAKLNWIIICQRALIDQANNVSIIQVLEELGVPAPPPDVAVPPGAIIPIQLTVATSWQRANNEKSEVAKGRLRLISPGGKTFGRSEFEIDLKAGRRSRQLGELGGMPYHGPGTYLVKVDVAVGKRWRTVGETDFLLHHNMPAPVVAVKH